MAKKRRQARNQPVRPPDDQRSVLKRHARIWLATLSTVVGVATGMFTLRDQVFPGEAGSAQAVSGPAYQQQFGRICDQVNANDRRRAHEDTIVRISLKRATTTTAQRNALLDPVRRTVARSGHTLASFAALDTPTALAASRRDTEAAWNRNLARLRDYALQLDRVTTRAQLLAAVDHLSSLRPLLTSDGVTLASGLERLGAANCDLQAPKVTATITLPPLPAQKTTHRHHRGARQTGSSRGGSSGSTRSVNTPPPGPSSSRPPSGGRPGSVNTPGAGANGGGEGTGSGRIVNTPGAGSTGGGGGGADGGTGSGRIVNTPGAGSTGGGGGGG